MKKAVVVIGGVAVILGVVVGWFLWKSPPRSLSMPTLAFVEVDWTKEVPSAECLRPGECLGTIAFSSPLELKDVYPYSDDVAERYFTRLKLSFEGSGRLGETNVIVRCEAVACPRLVPGDRLAIGFRQVEKVSSCLFDKQFENRVDADTQGVESRVREEVLGMTLYFDKEGVPPEAADSLVRIWVRTDGLEYSFK